MQKYGTEKKQKEVEEEVCKCNGDCKCDKSTKS